MGRPSARRELPGWLAALVRGAGEGAFAVDAAQRIVQWNAAAEALLGLAAREVVGRRCHEVFGARDPSGNLVCCPRCPLFVMVQRGEPVAPRDLMVTARGGERRWLSFSTLVLPEGVGVLHLLRDVSDARARECLADEIVLGRARTLEPMPAALSSLTRREVEILGLLIRGAGTREIAGSLFISPLTARNHVHHILRKLGTRTRAEAVALGLRNGLGAA